MYRHATILILASSLVVSGLLCVATARESGVAEWRGLPIRRTAHFTLAHTLSAEAATEVGELLETLYARYLAACRDAGFRLRVPAEPLPWLCTDDPRAYGQFAGPRAGGMAADDRSYYSAQSNTVALLCDAQDGTGAAAGNSPVAAETWRISHEVAHQMCFNTGLQTRGVLYPVWVSEGLAANFETHFPVAGGFAGDNPSRQRRLGAASREKRLLPLGEMVVLTSPPADDDACLDVYAEAWGMVQFLFQRDPVAFRRYLYTLALRPAGKRPAAALQAEFESAFGPIARLQSEWDGHLAIAAAPAPVEGQVAKAGNRG